MPNGASIEQWFAALTGHIEPHRWQRALAEECECRSRVIRVPTGLGKTEGVLAAWSLHRIAEADERWPRRLVWCLPMRVLVEQTAEVARRLADRMPAEQRPEVYIAMGGEDAGEWYLRPERPAILVGTQDMLLSRALNRGYASTRARWPIEFGLLSQDALWIMDEVQLMDVGLATSAQLQAFRDADSGKSLRPCHTWWMSATLQPEWLKSVDTAERQLSWIENPCRIGPDERHGGLWNVLKHLATEEIGRGDVAAFAGRIIREHAAITPGEHGRITLVVCNTVDRAVSTFDALMATGQRTGVELIHSRFRGIERSRWRERFLSRDACSPNSDRIIVSTQVVEAGVDISAGCLVTELAPWPSLVQRFGRCARYGGGGRVVVVDRGRDEVSAAPYSPQDLDSAWEALRALEEVGIAHLEAHEDGLSAEGRARLYPYSARQLLLPREFEELFDTTPDLMGGDLDISRFIRSGEERDLQVFWIELDGSDRPPAKRRPQQRELCAVPFLRARDWLCGQETKKSRRPRLRRGVRAWVWDWLDGVWVEATRASLVPGRLVCVDAGCGGYSTVRGFDSTHTKAVPLVLPVPLSREAEAVEEADSQQGAESQSVSDWRTIGSHCAEAATVATELAEALALPEALRKCLLLAALWHDWGKSHPAFQGAIRGADRPARHDVAKAPENAWLRPYGTFRYVDDSDTRPGFRHELASALGLFALLEEYAPQHPALLGSWGEALAAMGQPLGEPLAGAVPNHEIQRVLQCSAEEFDLLVYLVASHHGKVRMALHGAPKDQEYRDRDGRGQPIRGVREGDTLPAVPIGLADSVAPRVTLTLDPAGIGLSMRTGASWRERSEGQLERLGPAALALLEGLLRAADVRASRIRGVDPVLAPGVTT